MKNQRIFQQVVNSNLEALSTELPNEAYNKAMLKVTADMTEEEVRQNAVKLFYSLLAKKVSQQLSNNL